MRPDPIPFLKPDGRPLIEIVVGLSSAVAKAHREIGRPHQGEKTVLSPVSALIDTGSDRTYVPKEYVKRLGLSSVGVTRVWQPMTGSTTVELFVVSVNVMRKMARNRPWEEFVLVPTLEVGVLPANHEGATRQHPMPIVGRDVLSECAFFYDGPKQCVEFYTKHDLRRWWPFGR